MFTGNLKWVENRVSFVDVCCASNPFPEQNTKQAVHSRMMNLIVKLHAEESLFSRVVLYTDFARYQAKGPDICIGQNPKQAVHSRMMNPIVKLHAKESSIFRGAILKGCSAPDTYLAGYFSSNLPYIISGEND